MRKTDVKQQKLVYGLDIGTRSIVGTVGYLEKDRFVVVAQRAKEHETRSMIDGQIHDIGAVGETIREVTDLLETDLRQELKQACIAAAGRVLQTVTTHVEIDLEGEKVISKEDIFALDSYGVEKAYEEFQETNHTDMKFYCVGYTVMRYYMNDYPMGNLENHKAKVIAEDLIATFLPDDVVDGLYKAVELAGLEVANLTLEPIAAMEVAIPQMYRMLNIALIDVGAGTSDISITKDGSIVAYGMLPIAGDCMTEDIARHCLVDFGTAEQIKRGIREQDQVEYKDIMGLPQTISKEQVKEIISDHLTSMAQQAADKIMELNGGKPVSAVFVVGGGGKVDGYTDLVADRLGIAKERCALRGEEVMQKIDFMPGDIVKDSMLVTPIGICLNYYEQSNNFMFVTFNGQRIKLYDNNKLAIVDAAMQAEYPNENLFPKKGEALTFTFNGKVKSIRGERGESAEITLNGNPADIHTLIRANDVIVVKDSTQGAKATMELGKFPEYEDSITILVNDKQFTLPKFASVNGNLESAYYEIQENDVIELMPYYTVKQVTEVMDVVLDANMEIKVNNQIANLETKVYDNFSVEWGLLQENPVREPKNSQVNAPITGGEVSENAKENEAETVALNEASSQSVAAQPTVSENQSQATQPVYAQEVKQQVTMNQQENVDLQGNVKQQVNANLQGDGNAQAEGKPKMSMLERARASADKIASEPVSEEVEEEFKKARAYAAAERISSFATAFNQTGQMPPKQTQPTFRFGQKPQNPQPKVAQANPAVEVVKPAAQTFVNSAPAPVQEVAQANPAPRVEPVEAPVASPVTNTVEKVEPVEAPVALPVTNTVVEDVKPATQTIVNPAPAPVQEVAQANPAPSVEQVETSVQPTAEDVIQGAPEAVEEKSPKKENVPEGAVVVTVNGDQVVLTGKDEFVFVDVFDRIDFDLSRPRGKSVETLLNGRTAQYMETLKTGDVLEIYWRK